MISLSEEVTRNKRETSCSEDDPCDFEKIEKECDAKCVKCIEDDPCSCWTDRKTICSIDP